MIRPTMSHALNKDHLLELMSKYASYLEDKLAKFNERLKESEQVRTEYSFLIADLVRRADVKDDLYKNPTYQKASEQLNKFAIEKKIEGVNEFCSTLSTWEDVHPIGANYITSLSAHRDFFNEQLRKEQE